MLIYYVFLHLDITNYNCHTFLLLILTLTAYIIDTIYSTLPNVLTNSVSSSVCPSLHLAGTDPLSYVPSYLGAPTHVSLAK